MPQSTMRRNCLLFALVYLKINKNMYNWKKIFSFLLVQVENIFPDVLYTWEPKKTFFIVNLIEYSIFDQINFDTLTWPIQKFAIWNNYVIIKKYIYKLICVVILYCNRCERVYKFRLNYWKYIKSATVQVFGG